MTFKHICPVCGRIVLGPGKLKIHMRKHTGERPFTCEYCEKSFMSSSNINKHIRKVHDPNYRAGSHSEQAPTT